MELCILWYGVLVDFLGDHSAMQLSTSNKSMRRCLVKVAQSLGQNTWEHTNAYDTVQEHGFACILWDVRFLQPSKWHMSSLGNYYEGSISPKVTKRVCFTNAQAPAG